jgi:hypothetical protein
MEHMESPACASTGHDALEGRNGKCDAILRAHSLTQGFGAASRAGAGSEVERFGE